MLRSVIAGFLAELDERDLDLPLLALLRAEGFVDIHFTHGNAEFGKDFIAKREENGVLEQWCFQSKAGDIGQPTWRNEVQGQLLEAATSGLGHPAFDATIPRRVVLVTTGRLVGNAPVAAKDFNDATIVGKLHLKPLEFWTIDSLPAMFERHGASAFGPSASGLRELGALLTLYGEALEGRATTARLENHSQRWLRAAAAVEVFRVVFEASILAEAFRRKGQHYEEMQVFLALQRGLLAGAHDGHADSQSVVLSLALARRGASAAAHAVVREVSDAWQASGNDLVRSSLHEVARPAHYLVFCARAIEAAALAAFWSPDSAVRDRSIAFLLAFATQEPGAGHPLSDRYAVSVVWAVVALARSSQTAAAKTLILRAALWTCDRYETEGDLAPVAADPEAEVEALLGRAFPFLARRSRRQSFLACALVDLAAWLGDEALYGDLVNDFAAVRIMPQYWQAADTVGQFFVEANDVVQYANIKFASALPVGATPGYARHIVAEPATFRAVADHGALSYVGVSLLLRDRYFPRLWSAIMSTSDVKP